MNADTPRKPTYISSKRVMVATVALLAATTWLSVYLVGSQERNRIYRDIASPLTERVKEGSARMQRVVRDLQSDARFLARSPRIEQIVRALSAGHGQPNGNIVALQASLQKELSDFIETQRPAYMQVRLIGVANQGKELVRVNLRDGQVVATPADQLQKKGDRDYFQAAIRLQPGQVHLSRINLNQEWGRVDVPLVPTLRASTPIYSENGKVFAVLVMNLNMSQLFERLQTGLAPGVVTYLINDKGDYLIHPDSSKTFGFDLGRRYRWQDEFISLDGSETLPVADPGTLREIRSAAGMVMMALDRFQVDPAQPERTLTLAYGLPEPVIEERVQHARAVALIIAAAIGLVLLAFFYFSMRYRFQPLKQLAQTARRLGDGDYSAPTPVVWDGEVAAFVQEFTGMRERIRQRDEEIQQLNTVLRRSEELANSIIDTAPKAMVVVDGTGRIVRVNLRVEQVFGYRRDELVGQSIELLLPDRYRQPHSRLREGYARQSSLRMMGEGRELFARRKDGSEFHVEVGLGPMRIGDEQCVIASVADISQRKVAEAALLETSARLARSNAELEQFTYIASHDLQEPLRMVASYVQLLERRYRDRLDKDAHEFIEYAVDGVKRMQALINGLLGYSRVQSRASPPEPVDLNQVLKTVQADMAILIGECDARIVVEALPSVQGDPTQLRQLFQNLIGNALKYRSDHAPRIHVESRRIEEAGIDLPSGAPTHGWLISVSDNGLGIEAQYFERIFQLFQRLHTRQEYEGTGLGLALCRRVIERHGGVIWVRSEPGKGSTFFVALPDSAEPGSSKEPASARVVNAA